MNAGNRLTPFERLLLATRKIANAAIEANIDPEFIIVTLSTDQWVDLLGDRNVLTQPQTTLNAFKLNGVTVTNIKLKP